MVNTTLHQFDTSVDYKLNKVIVEY